MKRKRVVETAPEPIQKVSERRFGVLGMHGGLIDGAVWCNRIWAEEFVRKAKRRGLILPIVEVRVTYKRGIP